MSIKLNLGAGDSQLPGFINVDRNNGGECFPLVIRDASKDSGNVAGFSKVEDSSVDEIYASHVLEHFPSPKIRDVLKEWARVLKPGGTIKIAVPNFDFIHDEYAKHKRGEPFDNKIFGYLFGGQTDENDYHHAGFNAETLGALMEEAGFDDIQPWKSELQDCAALPVSLNLMGTRGDGKPRMARHGNLPKIHAIMSMPRLAFSQNMFCALQELGPLGIEFTKMEGAFWSHCLSRGMKEAIDGGAEYILTIDYDSVFKREQFLKLVELMQKYPQADAIAPLQCKRDEDHVLLGLLDEDGKPYPPGTTITTKHFEPEIVPSSWAHFGLTIFRTSALKKMPKPWFYETPDKGGDWGEGRVDADIGFWRNFTGSGNRLYVAPRVPLGHLQLFVSWPGEDFSPVHQYTIDYQNHGIPKEVRR